MNSKPEVGTIVTFTSGFGSETGKVVGYATLDPDTLQIESNGDIFAKHYSDVTVVVETPAAPDSDYQPMVGDDVSIKYTTDNYHGIVRDVTSDSISIVRYNQTILSFLLSDVIVTLVSRPTSAPVAITDDSAVDNTPSEVEREIEQPSASDEYTLQEGDTVEFYLAFDAYPHWGTIIESFADTKEAIIKYGEMGLYIKRRWSDMTLSQVTQPSGWLADALQTVNVTNEAVANDEYLPPTVDEDNDDLPFSDLGEDDTPNWTSIDGDIIDSQRERIYELEAQNWQRNETITSLEADLKAYHSLFSELWDTVQLAEASEFVDEMEAILKSFERAQIMRKAGK